MRLVDSLRDLPFSGREYSYRNQVWIMRTVFPCGRYLRVPGPGPGPGLGPGSNTYNVHYESADESFVNMRAGRD